MSQLKFAKVSGWSMMPILKEGDIVGYRDVQYNPSDIILFEYGGLIITHRLIQTNSGFVTKGDNLPFLDKKIEKKNIIGVAEFAIRGSRLIYLNRSSVNKRLRQYSLIEINLISLIKKKLRLNSNIINGIIKKILSPLYTFNYLLLLANSK